MEPTNCMQVMVRMKQVQCFCLLWGTLLWPIKNNPVRGEQRDSKKPKLQPKIAALGKTHCLERSRIYDGSGLVPLAINKLIYLQNQPAQFN